MLFKSSVSVVIFSPHLLILSVAVRSAVKCLTMIGFLLFLLVVVSVFVLHISRPGYLVHLYFKLLPRVLSAPHPHLGLVHF